MLVIINMQDVIPAFRATRNMHEIRDTKYDNKRAIKKTPLVSNIRTIGRNCITIYEGMYILKIVNSFN